MSKTETGKIENVLNAGMLRDNELEFVSGGFCDDPAAKNEVSVELCARAIRLADQNYKG